MRILSKATASLFALLMVQLQPSLAQAGLGPDSEASRGFECEVVPPSRPLWFKAEWVAKEFPTKENLDLSSWCQSTEELMAQTFRHQQAWNPSVKRTNCTFLLSPNGDIEDAFICLGGDRASEEFALSVIAKAGPCPDPPKYLANRRLNLCLHYPAIELFVDFYEHKDDHIYFDGIRARSFAQK